MKSRWKILVVVGLLAVIAGVSAVALRRGRPEPPQFVLLTFDGGRELEMWERTLAFSRDVPVQFTYFVSGAYFVEKGDFGLRDTNIGFGKGRDQISKRIDVIYRAKAAGHEIASHGTTHFNGAARSLSDWQNEFSVTEKITKTVIAKGRPALSFRGFRAPYLGWNPALLATEKARRMQYDSSELWAEQCLGVWPFEVEDGVFEFPILQVRDDKNVVKSLMDFTTFDRDGSHPDMREEFRRQTLEMYRRTFDQLYRGTRAPMIVLTHFGADRMNDNAYLLAMEDFAREVCTKPDVRCTTIGAALDWMLGHPDNYPGPGARAERCARPRR